MITRRIVKIMAVNVLCPKCGHKWSYSGCAIKATCPSCYSKVQVRSLPDPGPRIVPAHFRAAPKSVLHTPEALSEKKRAGMIRGKIRTPKKLDSSCETVRGVVSKTPVGNLQEDLTVSALPVLKVHSRTPFTPAQLKEGIVCDHCHKLIQAPKMGYFVTGLPMHGRCIVDRALLECAGDLKKAAQLYDLPLKPLEKRAVILMSKGKLPVKADA